MELPDGTIPPHRLDRLLPAGIDPIAFVSVHKNQSGTASKGLAPPLIMEKFIFSLKQANIPSISVI